VAYLLDTGFFYALLNQNESQHARVVTASRYVHGTIYLPTPVITEVAYLILRDLGSNVLADFVDSLANTKFVLVEPTPVDFSRAAVILRQYRDTNIDFADAIIVAIAERLGITQVLTLDQRHFRFFRPRHCIAFDLLP